MLHALALLNALKLIERAMEDRKSLNTHKVELMLF